jgi:hypothetical protein
MRKWLENQQIAFLSFNSAAAQLPCSYEPLFDGLISIERVLSSYGRVLLIMTKYSLMARYHPDSFNSAAATSFV